MGGIFTREERAVVLFLAVSLLVGSAIVQARRVLPGDVPDFGGSAGQALTAPAIVELPAGPIDVNTAPVDDLVRLPGVGPVRAREIVRHREQNGRYSSLDDLLEVKGIGPVTLEGLSGEATVGDGAASTADTLVTSEESRS